MRRLIVMFVLLVCLQAVPVSVHGQQMALAPTAMNGETYISVQAGAVIDQMTDFDDTQNDGPLEAIGHFGSDTGFSLTGAVGHRLFEHVRFEGEIGYNRQGINEFFVREGIIRPQGPIFQNISTPARGNFVLLTGMGNVLVDFSITQAVTPYFGVGLGYFYGKFNKIDIGADLNRIDDGAGALGAQGIAGIAFKMHNRLSLDVSYRYVGNLAAFDFPNVARNDRFDYDYRIHKIMVGCGYSF